MGPVPAHLRLEVVEWALHLHPQRSMADLPTFLNEAEADVSRFCSTVEDLLSSIEHYVSSSSIDSASADSVLNVVNGVRAHSEAFSVAFSDSVSSAFREIVPPSQVKFSGVTSVAEDGSVVLPSTVSSLMNWKAQDVLAYRIHGDSSCSITKNERFTL